MLTLPKGKDLEGLTMLLAGVFFRYAEGDKAWVDEMAQWIEKNVPEVP